MINILPYCRYLSITGDYTVDTAILNITKKERGFSGKTHSNESRSKISDSKKGIKNIKNQKLDQTQKDDINTQYKQGKSVTQLAKDFGIARSTVYRYLDS